MSVTPEQWRKTGRTIDLRDGRIFAVDLSGSNVPVIVLHGFPTSSWDFASAATMLKERGRRVVLFDFLGFGFSDKPHDAAYSLFEQAEIAIGIARELGIGRAHLWAHDMGTSVATELLALRERRLLPFQVASVTLMNGSIHIDMANPTLGQRLLKSPLGPAFARLSRKQVFVSQMRSVFSRSHPPSEADLDGMWNLVTREDGQLRFPAIIRYMEERVRFRRRWIGALERLDVPALIAWGELDPVARLAIGERLARETPGADLITWNDLGHYPHVEAPQRVVEGVMDFIARVEDGRASLTGPESLR
jgi:pimeloyl-ACP methyl ester carboxylesterase